MLSSIHPLGERGRNSKYPLTVAAYIVGSISGGLVVGALFGGIGELVAWLVVIPAEMLAAIVVAVAATGVVLDLRLGGLHLPSYHRQVNEEWLTTYRGWVYGLGFGAQLGFGLATIVPTAGIYAIFLISALSGSIVTGAIIGLTFGAVRSLMILSMRGATSMETLRNAHRRLAGAGAMAHRLVVGAQAGLATVMIGVLLWR